MKLKVPLCPECNEPAIGTLETLQGVANFGSEPVGDWGAPIDVEYGGDTDIWWNSQKSVRNDKGETEVTCENDHTWFTEIT